MVQKFIGFFSRESGSLNQAAFVLGFFAIISQTLAFLRDRLLAHIFGAGMELDIYYAAFRIPDFIFITVASLVSLSVLVPFIIEEEALGKESLRKFIDSVFSFFSLAVVLSAGLAYIFMPYLMGSIYQGFSAEVLVDAIFLSRLLLFSPIILGVSNLFGSITQARNRFALYALAPVLYNGGIIIGTIFLAERFGILGVILGVIIGALLHALVQLPPIIKEGLMPRPSFPDWSIVRRVASASVPRTLTLAMSSFALIFLLSSASAMEEGSISILSFSNNLQSVLLSVIGVSYSLAAFPILSKRFLENNLAAFVEQMINSARPIIFWSLPASALLIVLRAQIVRVVLGTGLFDWSATRLTAAALAIFVISSVFQSLALLFMRGFYSAGFTMKPLVVSIFSTAVIIISSLIFVDAFKELETFRLFWEALFKVEDISGNVMLMLPLGFSLGTVLNAMVLWGLFEREFKGFSAGVARAFFESLGASVIMGAVAYFGLGFFVQFFDTSTLFGILSQGFLAGALSILAGIAVLLLLKNRELNEIITTLKGKFSNTQVIAENPEIV